MYGDSSSAGGACAGGRRDGGDMGRHSEVVNPDHYCGTVECIDAIRAALGPDKFISYCQGQVLKYIWRAGKKGDDNWLTDLQKAEFYLDMMLGKDPRSE